jgi:Lipid A 3-O-deacylase (PagL)
MKTLLLMAVLASCVVSRAWAQGVEPDDGPRAGGHEVQAWTGGGRSVAGGTRDTSAWNLGLRYGWVLTNPFLPGPLKGRFEYAVDAIPAFVIFQRGNTVYGAGINPLNLKWNFSSFRRVVPYVELSGGVLFTNEETPPGTSKINFTPGAGLGAHFLRGNWNWSAELRYLHISNAGLTTPNPGINTVQVRVGLGRFRK